MTARPRPEDQSAYAPEGERSRAQREHDSRETLDLLAKISGRAGYHEGYQDGYEAGRQAGRLEVWRNVGIERLLDSIEQSIESARRLADRLEAAP